VMKSTHIVLGIVSFLFTTMAMAGGGNDPHVNTANYKHPNKAAKAKRIEEEASKQGKTVVVKKIKGPANYKNNFEKAEYTTEKVPGNQGTFNADYVPRNHNYKKQF
ncbi:MAG: hypothetical protein H7259_02910, partial [Cytophagales bacterium]|nr:hypothetical protein [Cytophaga sp.]